MIPVASTGSDQSVQAALRDVNEYRRSRGLAPVYYDAVLSRVSASHLSDLSRRGRLSHFGADGSSLADRLRRQGYHYRAAAENLGTGHGSYRAAVRAWIASPSHRRILLHPDVTRIGIAVIQGPNGSYQGMVLARPESRQPPAGHTGSTITAGPRPVYR